MKDKNDKKDISNELDYKQKSDSKEVEVGEDTTKYGEFISSYFAWVTLPEQKDKVKKLENITKTSEHREENKNRK